MHHPYFGNGPPHQSQSQQPRRRTSTQQRKERPDVDKIVDGVISQLKTKGLFDQFRRDCLSDVDTKPSYINLQSKVNGTVESFLKSQTWSPSFAKLKMRDVMRKKIEEAPYFVNGLDSIVDQALGVKVESIFRPIIEGEVFDFMGCVKEEYDEKERLKLQEAEEYLPRPPSPPPPPNDIGEERHFKMLGSDLYHMPGYVNNQQFNSNFEPPPLPPVEPPPPPPEDEEDDEQMDYTPVTPPYPPPVICVENATSPPEPFPPGEEKGDEQMDYTPVTPTYSPPTTWLEDATSPTPVEPLTPPEKTKVYWSYPHHEPGLENLLEKGKQMEIKALENPQCVHMNGWAGEGEDKKEMNLSPKSETVEEEDSEEESPMFEKIGEVSPPRPVLLENSDDILRELQEQARLNGGAKEGKEIIKDQIADTEDNKNSFDVFDDNSRDSGSSNLVICEDTPPQEPVLKSEEKGGIKDRKSEYSENSNSSSASSRHTPHKKSYSSSSKDRKESTSKEPKASSSIKSSRHHGRSSRSSSNHRSGDRNKDRDASNTSNDRDQDKDKCREKSESSSKSAHGSSSKSHKHSSNSSSHKRSSSSHSSQKHSNSSSSPYKHSSSASSHRHSSYRSSSSAKSDKHLSSTKSEKNVKSKSISSICGESSNSPSSSKDMELSNSSDQMTPKFSDASDTLSPFKLPEQLKPFASIGLSKSSDRDRTIIQQPTTFSITLDMDYSDMNRRVETSFKSACVSIQEKGMELMDMSEDKVLAACDNGTQPSPSAKGIGCSEDVDESCKYLEPIPVFEEKLSYYRKLSEFQMN